jgi:uncharacterized protein (TIGR02922 family)
MNIVCLKQVTVIYYDNSSLELLFDTIQAKQDKEGRVIIPKKFKINKSVITVIEGKAKIMNSMGDRIVANVKAA